MNYDPTDYLDLNDVDAFEFEFENSIADASLRNNNLTFNTSQIQTQSTNQNEKHHILNLSILEPTFSDDGDKDGYMHANNSVLPFNPRPELQILGQDFNGHLNLLSSPEQLLESTPNQMDLTPDANVILNPHDLSSLAEFLAVSPDRNAIIRNSLTPGRLAPCSTLLPGSKIATLKSMDKPYIPVHDLTITTTNEMVHTVTPGQSIISNAYSNSVDHLDISNAIDLTNQNAYPFQIGQSNSNIITNTTNTGFDITNAKIFSISDTLNDSGFASSNTDASDATYSDHTHQGSHTSHPNGHQCLVWACKACKRKTGPHDR